MSPVNEEEDGNAITHLAEMCYGLALCTEDDEAKLERLKESADALWNAENFDGAEDRLQAAIEIARRLGNFAVNVILTGMIRVFSDSGRRDMEDGRLEQALVKYTKAFRAVCDFLAQADENEVETAIGYARNTLERLEYIDEQIGDGGIDPIIYREELVLVLSSIGKEKEFREIIDETLEIIKRRRGDKPVNGILEKTIRCMQSTRGRIKMFLLPEEKDLDEICEHLFELYDYFRERGLRRVAEEARSIIIDIIGLKEFLRRTESNIGIA